MSQSKNQVPMGQKIAFGLGMLANQMFPAALGIFMVILVQNLGFTGKMYSLVYFIPRIFDAFTDPMMGFISDNTKSRWGRRRHYVFIGALIMGISFVSLWQLFEANGAQYNFVYFIIWSIVFYLGLTIFSVPYVAMGYEMSNDFHERTNIMAIAQSIGQWAWVIAPWFWVILFDDEMYKTPVIATRTLSIYVGIFCMILAMIPAIFIKSESTLNEKSYAPLTFENIGGSVKKIIEGFSQAFQIGPFRKLCIATFFIFNAFNTVAGFSWFIIVWYLFKGDPGAAGRWPTLFGSIGALITTFAVIPTVAWMSRQLGKRNAFLASQAISIFGYILFWFLFVPGKPYLFLFALPFFSFGIGSLFTLMMSMTSDVLDLDELENGERREGTFGAIYWWTVKFGFAIAGGLSGLIFDWVKFDGDLPQQTPETLMGLRLFFSGVPIVGTLAALFVMRNYPISEEKAGEIRAELDKRKHPTTSSGYNQQNLLLGLSALEFQIDSKIDTEFRNKSEHEIKKLFHNSLNSGVYGFSFSPYREGQNIGDQLSKEQIIDRMKVISPYTKWVRSFSCTEGNENIPIVARHFGVKTLVGAWLSNDLEKNELEINGLINLAKQGYVDIAVVGNEVLLRAELTEMEMINYIQRVKEAVPGISIGYADAYFQFLNRPKLIEQCDVILANCYPFWEGYSIEEASVYLRQMYQVTKNVSQGKPVIVSETGWPSEGSPVQNSVPSAINAMKYFITTNNWVSKEQIELFYFSSFDESWKMLHEGDVGNRWGIWDKNEQLKF